MIKWVGCGKENSHIRVPTKFSQIMLLPHLKSSNKQKLKGKISTRMCFWNFVVGSNQRKSRIEKNGEDNWNAI